MVAYPLEQMKTPGSSRPLRAQVLQHVPFEGPAALEPRLRRAGFQIETTRFFDRPVLPDPAAVDFLVALGGPMSVNDESALPWLAAEKDFIRRYLATGQPFLGVCLGAQLLASALGARVFPNRVKEIGWLPVAGIAHGNPAAFRFPETANVFHWHGETFDLPPGAEPLARSGACANQAFQIGAAVGLQFHLETTPASARARRDSTATTTPVMSDGTPDTSMIEIGRPSDGSRNILPMKFAIVSATSMPENMKL